MTAAAATAPTSPSKGLHIALWVVQVLLSFAFLMSGVMKTTQPFETLHANMAWTNHAPDLLIRFIGTMEFLGGLGLILPSALRIMPRLTGYAALGLTTIMVLAIGFHTVIGEMGPQVVNAVLGGMAAFVAWGRLKKVPIAARG